MAIQKDIELQSGITVEGAYIRIENITGNKANLTVCFTAYKSMQAFNEGKGSIESYVYNFIPSQDESAERWDNQAYAFIKSQPEFHGAIDC